MKYMHGLPRGRVEHGRQTGPLGTPCPTATHALIILGGVRDMSVADVGGHKVNDGLIRSIAICQPHRPRKFDGGA